MIPLHKVLMAPNVAEEVGKVLNSGYVAQGPKVEEFEDALEKVLGARVLTVNSGTSALELAYHLVGIGPGDYVISTPCTCTATNTPLGRRHANILWADVDPITGNIDPQSVARILATHDNVKAIVAVDWAGRPCDYTALREVAGDIPIIEDAAHAFGATYNKKPLGQSPADYVCWSFQAIKHLNTGDGGAICVPFNEITRARKLRWFGMDREPGAHFKQNITEAGYKFHMNDIAATIGLANLSSARAAVDQQRDNARYYHKHLKDACIVPPPSDESSWWLYCIKVSSRNAFLQFAKEKGFESSPVHGRNDKHWALNGVSCHQLVGVEQFSLAQTAIPCGWWVSREDMDLIINAIKEWWRYDY